MKSLIVTCLVLLDLTGSNPVTTVNKCPQPTASNPVPPALLYAHPGDCQYFYTCAFGTAYLMQCPAGTSFSDVYQTCVHKFSTYDTCEQEKAACEILTPHPSLCNRFFNSSLTSPVDALLGPSEDECPYPQYFDAQELRCRPFAEVTCGDNRTEVKDRCGYVKAYSCSEAHCEKCSSVFPSCVGLADGLHPNPDKLWTPLYVSCAAERQESLTCGTPVVGTLAFFSPVKNQCVSRYEVPANYGGLLPKCGAKAPGRYVVTLQPRVYYTCPDVEVFYCPAGQVFNEVSQQCEPIAS
ncbi:unnamed protein product [Lymnaea stagnalis]|uniref:Chitin-binding type-2 domain-containing protein n=1 Tax=Lymnaea stagnalis TaxID=6523 RepID=A0AAV2H8M1_LYMST